MSDIKLLPCAHCGHDKNELYNNADEDTEGFFWTGILCNCCRSGFSIGGISIETNQEIILRKWNRHAPQPVTVIVPPLEWEEINARGNRGFRFSTGAAYYIEPPINGKIACGECLGFEIGIFDTEAEAMAACQNHNRERREARIKQAVEGCNVRPYRDPQPSIDAMKTELRALGADVRAGAYNPSSRVAVHIERMSEQIKKWETGA